MGRTAKLFITAGIAAAAGLIAVESVSAQIDVIAQRRQTMRNFQSQLPGLNAMARGTAPYDAAKVQATLDVYALGASQLGGLFPDTSKAGDTHALPAVWENKADFAMKLATFTTDVAAAKGAAGDETAGKAAIMKVAGDCGACHQMYRQRPPAPAGGAPGAAPAGGAAAPAAPAAAMAPGVAR